MSCGATRDSLRETSGAWVSTIGGRYLCIILNRQNRCLVVQPGTHQGKLLEHGYPQWEVGISVLYWTDRTDVLWCNKGLIRGNYWSTDIHNGRYVSLYYTEQTERMSCGATRDASGETTGTRISAMGGRYLRIILNRQNGCLVVQPGTHYGKLLEHGYPQWGVGISVLYWTDRTDVLWCNQGLIRGNYWSTEIHNGR